MTVLISNNRQADKPHHPWIHFFKQLVQKEKEDCVDVRQDDESLSLRDKSPDIIQETCAYCSFYEFGWCTFHQKSIASDAEICNEIKQLQ